MAVATPVYNLLGGLRNRILDRGTVRRDELRRMMRAAANGATDLNGSEFLDALSRVRRRVHASITDGEMRLLYRHFAARAGGANVPVEEVLAALDLPETPPPPEDAPLPGQSSARSPATFDARSARRRRSGSFGDSSLDTSLRGRSESMSVASAPSTILSEATTQDPRRREEALQAFAGRPVEARLKQLIRTAIDEGRSVYGRTVRSAEELFDAMQRHSRRRGQGGVDPHLMTLDTFRAGLRRLGVGLTRQQELGAFAQLARTNSDGCIPRDAFVEYFPPQPAHSPGTHDGRARARRRSSVKGAPTAAQHPDAFQRLVRSVHTLVSSHRLVMGRQVNDLHDLFAVMDNERADTPDLLTRDEFVRGLLRTGLGVSRAQAEEVFHACDSDGDGVVSYKEFLARFKFAGEQEERPDDTRVTAAMQEVQQEARKHAPKRHRRHRPARIQDPRAERVAVQLLRAAVRSRRESFSAVLSELDARFHHWEQAYTPPHPEDAGTVSRAGFVSTFTAMGVRVSREQAADLFAALDPEDTDRIDYRTFLAHFAAARTGAPAPSPADEEQSPPLPPQYLEQAPSEAGVPAQGGAEAGSGTGWTASGSGPQEYRGESDSLANHSPGAKRAAENARAAVVRAQRASRRGGGRGSRRARSQPPSASRAKTPRRARREEASTVVDEAEAAAAPPKTLAQSVFIRLVRFLIARGSVTQDLGGLADRLANHDPARLGAVPCPVLSGVLAECCREWGVAVGEEEREAVVDALPRVKRWQLERTHGRSGGDPWGEDGDADMWGVPASPGCHQPGAAAAPLCWYTTLLSEFNAEVQTHSQVVSQVRHTVRSGRTLYGSRINGLLTLFSLLDRDGDARLSRREMIKGTLRLDLGFAPSELADLVTRMDTADEGFVTVSEFVAYLSPADPLEPAGQKSPAQRAFLRLAGRVASMRGRGGTRWFESAELTLEGADRHQTGTLPRELFEDSVCALEAGPTREEATELFASLCGSLHPSCRAPYPSLLRRLRREVGWRRAHASRLRAALRDSADAWRSMHAPWLPRAAAEASLTAGESRTNRTLARTGSMGPHSVQRTRTTRVPAPPRTFSALWRSMDPNGRGAVGIADIAVAYARCGAIAHAHEAVAIFTRLDCEDRGEVKREAFLDFYAGRGGDGHSPGWHSQAQGTPHHRPSSRATSMSRRRGGRRGANGGSPVTVATASTGGAYFWPADVSSVASEAPSVETARPRPVQVDDLPADTPDTLSPHWQPSAPDARVSVEGPGGHRGDAKGEAVRGSRLAQAPPRETTARPAADNAAVADKVRQLAARQASRNEQGSGARSGAGSVSHLADPNDLLNMLHGRAAPAPQARSDVDQ